MGCSPSCWTSVTCTVCGKPKAPRGRSVPLDSYYCDRECRGYDQDPPPPPLWSEHDSTRVYTDPMGWEEHLAHCPRCQEENGVSPCP